LNFENYSYGYLKMRLVWSPITSFLREDFMKITSILLSVALSASAMANVGSYTCEPSPKNSYFTENVSLSVLNESTIFVNRTHLAIDESYDPRTMVGFERFLGDTAKASGWADSGYVEIFLKPETRRLIFQVRSDTFITESFTCK
jgi:hypothetical protein